MEANGQGEYRNFTYIQEMLLQRQRYFRHVPKPGKRGKRSCAAASAPWSRGGAGCPLQGCPYPSREPCMHVSAHMALPFAWILVESVLGTASAHPFSLPLFSRLRSPTSFHTWLVFVSWFPALLPTSYPKGVCTSYSSRPLRHSEPRWDRACSRSSVRPSSPVKRVCQKRWRERKRCHTTLSSGPAFQPSCAGVHKEARGTNMQPVEANPSTPHPGNPQG